LVWEPPARSSLHAVLTACDALQLLKKKIAWQEDAR
jgi:hypothetical protein